MSTEFVLADEDEAQPLVRWFPSPGPLRTLSNEFGAPAAIAVGLLAAAALTTGAVWLIRRSMSPEVKALKVDKLVVRKITVLENAARYQ